VNRLKNINAEFISRATFAQVPTLYDLIFLWIYDVSLFLTGLFILTGIIWVSCFNKLIMRIKERVCNCICVCLFMQKKQKLVSWMILVFLLIQAFAFGVAVAMLTLDRFKGTSFDPKVQEMMFQASPQLVVSIVAGFHCIGSFIYILILIACVHKLNEKFSPYWK